MADRQDSDREVLTSLPRSRPVRRSAKRGGRPAVADTTKTAPASSKPAAAQGRAAAPRRKAGAGKPRAAAGNTKTRTTAPSTAAASRQRQRRPERVAPTRKVPPAGYAAPATRAERDHGAGVAEMLSTAIQAANELTQIGLTVGRQALQSILDRLPKP